MALIVATKNIADVFVKAFGLEGMQDITRIQLDADYNEIPTITITRLVTEDDIERIKELTPICKPGELAAFQHLMKSANPPPYDPDR